MDKGTHYRENRKSCLKKICQNTEQRFHVKFGFEIQYENSDSSKFKPILLSIQEQGDCPSNI